MSMSTTIVTVQIWQNLHPFVVNPANASATSSASADPDAKASPAKSLSISF